MSAVGISNSTEEACDTQYQCEISGGKGDEYEWFGSGEIALSVFEQRAESLTTSSIIFVTSYLNPSNLKFLLISSCLNQKIANDIISMCNKIVEITVETMKCNFRDITYYLSVVFFFLASLIIIYDSLTSIGIKPVSATFLSLSLMKGLCNLFSYTGTSELQSVIIKTMKEI